MKSQFNTNQNFFINATIIFILFILIFLSVYQGAYRIDPHHWGLMLSSAKDLVEGKLPYKDIYNIYGMMTTLVHAFAYKYLGANFFAIILITAVFYVIGLWILFQIALKITDNKKISLFSLVISILLHPVAIYPWSNYIAFPFLMGGIYFLISNQISRNKSFFAGFLFSFAILSREGVAAVVVLIIISFFGLDFIFQRKKLKETIKEVNYLIVGSLIPIVFFVSYLYANKLIDYWKVLAISIPKAYASGQFPHMSTMRFLNPFLIELWGGIISKDINWIVVALILMVSATGFLYICKTLKSDDIQRLNIAKISIASLIFIITTLHIPEIFRIATGSVIGIIVLFYWSKVLKIENIIFSILFLLLSLNLLHVSNGNPFYPEVKQRSVATYITEPKIIKGQLWPREYGEYYTDFEKTMNEIQRFKCNIKYHYNQTMDTVLYILSPFQRMQLTPYEHPLFDNLRPDLDYKNKISEAKDLIIFKVVSIQDLNKLAIPKGYVIYKKSKAPITQWVYKSDDNLLVLIPKICIEN